MKIKIPVVIVISLLAIAAKAQPRSGDFLLEGRLSFYKDNISPAQNDEVTGLTYTGFTFAPSFGFFANKRLAFGMSTLIDYEATTRKSVLYDTAFRGINFTTRDFELNMAFGGFVSYFIPLGKNMFFRNTVDVQRGTLVRGDRLNTLFEENKPQQDRMQFITVDYRASFTYFIKPHLPVSFGFSPLQYSYNFNSIIRFSGDSERRTHKLDFRTSGRYFFVTLSYLIISDNE